MAAGSAGLLIGAVLIWRKNLWSPVGRAAVATFVLVALAFLLFLHHWNVLGYR